MAGPQRKPRSITPTRSPWTTPGNLYICDIGNHRVRRVNLKTGIIETFAGTGQKKPTPDGAKLQGTPLNGPRALDFDPKSNQLFLALREGNAVYRIDLKTETLHHIAGTGKKGYAGDGGPAKRALLSGPKGVALGPKGDIYLADTESHTIRVIHRKSGTIETLVGDGKKGDGPDGDPRRCRLNRPHGNLWIGTGRPILGIVPTTKSADSPPGRAHARSRRQMETSPRNLAAGSRLRQLWLALIGFVGFFVLVGGPWVLGLLTKLFGPAALKPGRVITLDMLFTLPLAIYFWIHERRLESETLPCPGCGERYAKTNTSCPMCGSARPQEDKEKKQPSETTATSAKT